MKKFLFLISLIIVLASCQKEEEKQPDLTVVDILQSVLDFFAPANQTEDIKPQQHQNRTKPCQPVKSWKHLNHTRKPYCVIPPKPHFNHTKPQRIKTELYKDEEESE